MLTFEWQGDHDCKQCIDSLIGKVVDVGFSVKQLKDEEPKCFQLLYLVDVCLGLILCFLPYTTQ